MHAEEPAWWFRSGAGLTVSLSSWRERHLRIKAMTILIDDDHVAQFQGQVTDLQQLLPQASSATPGFTFNLPSGTYSTPYPYTTPQPWMARFNRRRRSRRYRCSVRNMSGVSRFLEIVVPEAKFTLLVGATFTTHACGSRCSCGCLRRLHKVLLLSSLQRCTDARTGR